MCLILLAYRVHHKYPLIIAANRDEYYSRPTAPADFWKNSSNILGGKDLQGGGTWLGVAKDGRIAAITNFRDPAHFQSGRRSRGFLASDFLEGSESPERYLSQIARNGTSYNGFNLLVGDTRNLWYFSNIAKRVKRIEPGIHGISNHFLNTPWPKIERGKGLLSEITASKSDVSLESLFKLLSDKSRFDDDMLPDTGVGLEWERILAPLFIQSPGYGTRSSTVMLVHSAQKIVFIERTYKGDSQCFETRTFQFAIKVKE